ncbi:MAG: PAS domain S-box protein [Desulfobacteraceae bacterium]
MNITGIEHNAILNNIPMFMIIVDQNLRVKKVSRKVSQRTGQSAEKCNGLRGGEALRCVHHLDAPGGCGCGPSCLDCKVRQTVLDTLETGNSHVKVQAELSFFDDDEPARHLLVSTSLLETSGRNVLIFIEDITKRKRAEIVLREQKKSLTALLETISTPIFYKDKTGKYTGCNRVFEQFIGRPRSQIIGKTVYEIGAGKIADEYYEKDMELLRNPGRQRYESKVRRNDGRLRDVIFDKAALQDAAGNVTGIVGAVSDITRQKKAERLVRDLSQMLMQAQEGERRMISCELHDSIAQNLSTLKLYCSRLGKEAFLPDFPGKKGVADMSALLDQTIASVRNLAYNLRPFSLDDLGVVAALDAFCEEFSEKNGLAVNFQAAGVQESVLSSEMQINLYRLVLEGVNNIQKHAAASRAAIRLVGAAREIVLRIEDNGRGFDVKERERSMVIEKRMGLRSMRERVNLLQGKMLIHSRLNRGTQIVIKLPLRRDTNGPEKKYFNR